MNFISKVYPPPYKQFVSHSSMSLSVLYQSIVVVVTCAEDKMSFISTLVSNSHNNNYTEYCTYNWYRSTLDSDIDECDTK